MARKALKTILSLVMVLSMLISVSSITAFANPAPEMVQNFEDTYYYQDGSAASASDWVVHLSKTAAETNTENLFDITLLVETKDTSIELAGSTHGAVALVLDVSNSMDESAKGCYLCGKAEDHADHKGSGSLCPDQSGNSYEKSNMGGKKCVNCGYSRKYHVQGQPVCSFQESPSHLTLLKSAVKGFLDSYVADAAEGDKRLVSIVEFYTNARTVQGWIDVNSGNNLALVKVAVDSLTTNHFSGNTDMGGTNMEAGLVLGRNLLKASDVSSIPVGNQSLILFSDGAPTAAVGDVNSTSTSSVSYDGGDRGTESNAKDSNDLSSILAAISAKKLAMAYNTDASLLKSVFGASNVITTSADSLAVDLAAEASSIITTETNASTVTDPMGYGVSMVSISSAYNGAWDLSQYTPVISNGITSYTITYQVELDPTVIAEDPNYPGYTIFTPANGATTLNYTVGEDATPVSADFNEPNIRGRLPENFAPFVSVVKTADKESYEIGETVSWTITVTNDSDYTAYNVNVVDQMVGINGTIQVLEPGASESFNAFSVAEAAGTLKNVVVISWSDGDEIPDTDEPDEPKSNETEKVVTVTEPEPVFYTLTVDYVDESGAAVAQSDVSAELAENSEYSTAPKSVEGYEFKEWDASSDAASGIMDSDKNVVYIYSVKEVPPVEPPAPPVEPVRYDLIVDHVTESGAFLLGDVLFGLEEGSPYSTAPASIDGYEFKEWDASSDAASGTMDSDKHVVYIYSVKEAPPVDPEPPVDPVDPPVDPVDPPVDPEPPVDPVDPPVDPEPPVDPVDPPVDPEPPVDPVDPPVDPEPPVDPVDPPVDPVDPPVEPVDPPVEPEDPVNPWIPSIKPSNDPYYPSTPTGGDELVDIPDEDVPLAAVPQTGDLSTLLLSLSAFSGSGLALIGLSRKKEEE